MNKNKLIPVLFSAMFIVVPVVFGANTTINNHNPISFTQRVRIVKYQPKNLNSEFVSSSVFTSEEEFSKPLLSLSKQKKQFSKKVSIAKESDFSNKPSSRPKSNDKKIFTSPFSILEDAEFSKEASSTPKFDQGEFSNMPSMPSKSSFSIR
ncbi:MAG: hypothetical protein WC412_01200 [Candidatus Omnitrophota bacterium]|jgi:hypothetical protein